MLVPAVQLLSGRERSSLRQAHLPRNPAALQTSASQPDRLDGALACSSVLLLHVVACGAICSAFAPFVEAEGVRVAAGLSDRCAG